MEICVQGNYDPAMVPSPRKDGTVLSAGKADITHVFSFHPRVAQLKCSRARQALVKKQH
jgi:hypothetical protein